jgi:aryl-alcohol dehydrogenase-like predicted oxidoreductase
MPSLEEQKKQYLQHYGALAVEEHGSIDVEKLKREQLLATARLLGLGEAEIEKIRSALEYRSFDEIVETLQNSLKYESRYAGEEELPSLIAEGWEVIFPTPINGKILVRRRRFLLKNEKEEKTG